MTPHIVTRFRLSLPLSVLCLPSIVAATTGPAHTGLIANANNAVSANVNPAGLTRIERPEWVGQILHFDFESEFAYTTAIPREEGVTRRDPSPVIRAHAMPPWPPCAPWRRI